MDTDPRIDRTRSAVLQCATELLVDGGPGAVTIDAIVARSGVAKSTIYRHWNSRDDVLFDVIERCAPCLEVPDPSHGFEASLRLLVDGVRRTLVDPEWARILPALLMLRNHEHGIADLDERLERDQEKVTKQVLRRGVQEGRLPRDIDMGEATAVLLGPLVFAQLTGTPKLTRKFADRVVDRFLEGFASRAS